MIGYKHSYYETESIEQTDSDHLKCYGSILLFLPCETEEIFSVPRLQSALNIRIRICNETPPGTIGSPGQWEHHHCS